jgi:hypothetical protein
VVLLLAALLKRRWWCWRCSCCCACSLLLLLGWPSGPAFKAPEQRDTLPLARLALTLARLALASKALPLAGQALRPLARKRRGSGHRCRPCAASTTTQRRGRLLLPAPIRIEWQRPCYVLRPQPAVRVLLLRRRHRPSCVTLAWPGARAWWYRPWWVVGVRAQRQLLLQCGLLLALLLLPGLLAPGPQLQQQRERSHDHQGQHQAANLQVAQAPGPQLW